MNLVEHIAKIAMEIDKEYPIDFAMLNIDEKSTYELMASGIIEMYLNAEKETREEILLATCTQLVVENFVLNLKLNEQYKDNQNGD